MYEVEGSGRTETVRLMPEWSETAQTNIAGAIRRQFGTDQRIVLKDLDLSRSSDATQEFETLRFWEPKDLYFVGRKAPPCVPRPLLALREAADGDALLLVYAVSADKSDEKQRTDTTRGTLAYLYPPTAALMIPFTLIFPRDWSQIVFGSGKTTIQICLIDSRTGDELWSYLGEFGGGDHLRDPAKLEAMVAEAFSKLQEAIGSASSQRVPIKKTE